jgi:hypothetical protein
MVSLKVEYGTQISLVILIMVSIKCFFGASLLNFFLVWFLFYLLGLKRYCITVGQLPAASRLLDQARGKVCATLPTSSALFSGQLCATLTTSSAIFSGQPRATVYRKIFSSSPAIPEVTIQIL